MKNFILCLFLTPMMSIVFWNVENFFDYKDFGYSASDAEYSSRGARHWTRKRFAAKANAVGKTLLWAGLPDIVGLAEVENDFVLRAICKSDVLRKYNYRFIHFESRDPRGIDVALLYREDRIALLEAEPLTITGEPDRSGAADRADTTSETHGANVTRRVDTLRTRDILYVCALDLASGDTVHCFVNHHPSKYGGKTSGPLRLAAMRTLKRHTDSLLRHGRPMIVAMGDFNDSPGGPAFGIIDSSLVNLGRLLIESSLYAGNTGTIRFNGKWELIDNFLVSPRFADKCSHGSKKGMEILRPPFLLVRDKRFPGEKPFRTYVGPRYNGGVSDHLPIRIF